MTQYHPDPVIDAEVLADAAEGARYDLSVGLPVTCCPQCGRGHGRGFVDGVSSFRCLHCGDVFSPGGPRCDMAPVERAAAGGAP